MRSKFFFLLSIFSLWANDDVPILTEDQSYIFRIAESYRELAQYDTAINWYKTVLEKKGPPDLIWGSKYGLGLCFEAQGKWPEALFWFLEAYQYNSVSLDPLLLIAKHYRFQNQNDLAYLFAKQGSRFTPSTDYRFDEELSIVAFYTRYREDGYKAASDLLLRKDTPWHIKAQAYENILFYVQNLKNTRFQPILIDLPPVIEHSTESYSPMNPSILKTQTGYKVICRTVNYTQFGARDFFTNDPNGYIRTRNYLLTYDKSFKLLSQQEIIDNLPREKYPSSIVLGLEDCRIFEWNHSTWFSCGTRDTNPAGIPQISLCSIPEATGETLSIDRLIPLDGPDPYRCEKNWLPFVEGGDLYFIYKYHPFTVYKPNLYTGSCETIIQYEPTHDLSLFRGSAGPIPFDNGYLLLVHEYVNHADSTRCYLHRFVYLDKHYMVKLVSKPFTFLHQGIEFCNSMTTDHTGKTLILALGIEDAKAYLCFTDLELVRSLLYPLQPNL